MERQEFPGLRGPALWGVMAGVFAVGSQSLLLSPLLKDIAAAFQVSERQAAYASLAYGLSLAVSAPLTGLLSDLLSRRHTLLAGLCGVMLAGLLAAFSPGLGILILSQGLAGFAAGCFMPSAYALVGDRVAYAERGKVMGRVIFGWAIAMVIGVPMGGLIGAHFGWRAALGLLFLLALGAMALVWLGLERTRARLPSAAQAVAQIRAACVSIASARRVPPLLLVNFLDMAGFFGVYTYLGTFARDQFSLGADGAGLLAVCYGIGMGTTSLNARLLDRIGKARALIVGLVGVGCVLCLIPQSPLVGWPALAILMYCWGLFQAACVTCLTTLISAQSDSARGALTAIMSCTTYLGVAAGAGAMGVVFETWNYALVGLLCGAGTLLGSLIIWRVRPEA